MSEMLEVGWTMVGFGSRGMTACRADCWVAQQKPNPGRPGVISAGRHFALLGLFGSLAILFISLIPPSAAAAGAKRVLVVHSFGSASPPFTTHSIAFETELTQKIGERVDLDEMSLDMARYAEEDMQEALVEYWQKRQAKWQPDLVVPVGSPAGIFVAQHRDRLFPTTPVLYTGLDKSRLPPGSLEKNAAFVGEDFDLPGFAEDIFQIAPGTTNIAVVVGASPLEQFWKEAFQKAFEPFTNRTSFTWLDDLSFDQMLDHVSQLPPRSFIFLILLLRDATGVSHNADEALRRIHAVANAPVNSIFQNQLGLGIVGGRLYQAELEGVESARMAIRILHGEPASSIPPRIIGALAPQYDWRELQRWGMSEGSLPPGSTIRFREPTVWERYRAWIIAAICVGVLQGIFILALLVNLEKRKRAERSLVESENRFRLAADSAPLMIWMSDTNQRHTFFSKSWLDYTGRTREQESGTGWTEAVHPDDLEQCLKTYAAAFETRQPLSLEFRLRRYDGEYRWMSNSARARQDTQGNFVGYIGLCLDVTESRRKTDALIKSESRLRSILDTAAEGIITINDRGVIESANAAAEKLFGHAAADMVGQEFTMLVPSTISDRRGTSSAGDYAQEALGVHREVTGQRKDGSTFPMDLVITEMQSAGHRAFTGFMRDVTAGKQAEQAAREFGGRLLQAQEAERARLARELHDDITQRLARLAIDAGRIESGRNGAWATETMREVRDGLALLSEDVHSLAYQLHPALLVDLGLPDALRAECERFSRQESISVDLNLDADLAKIPADAGLCLFRVAQEALRNVARHARSKEAMVSLRAVDGGLQLAVADSGVGFAPNQQRLRPSLGLASMRERVRLLGGEIDIESQPGQGTTMIAWVPHTKTEAGLV